MPAFGSVLVYDGIKRCRSLRTGWCRTETSFVLRIFFLVLPVSFFVVVVVVVFPAL